MIWSERPPAALGEYTGFLLNWVAVRSRRHFAQALEENLGLHPKEFGALTVIAGAPGVTQHDICEAAGMDPSSMVATLDALEAHGLAERRPHPEDRRKRSVHLTPAGERVIAEAKTLAGATASEVFGVLDPAERRELNRLLRKLAGLEAGGG
jgi:MarR family transcriptional regulator, lower aerobic nicotinate degradation pathway regulator